MDGFSYGSPYLDSLAQKYNYSKILHNTFDNIIVPEFKNRGFRKNGKMLYRKMDDLIEICIVQFSRDNTSINASFTYNIKIALPSLYDSLDIKYTDKREALIFDERFGFFLTYGDWNLYDYWYKLNLWNWKSTVNFQKEIARGEERYLLLEKLENRYNMQTCEGFNEIIANDIQNIIMKFFDSIPNTATLLKHVENDKPTGYIDETLMYNIAKLYNKQGDHQKAIKIFKKIKHSYFKDHIDELLKSIENRVNSI